MKPIDYQKRFAHVENWHVVTKTGVVHVGSPERLLVVVDESPSRIGQKVLGGAKGEKLADLFGFKDRDELLENVDALNLLLCWTGRAKTGEVLFLMRSAKREWNHLRFEAGGVILLGRVGGMLGLGPLSEVKTDYPSRTIALPRPSDRWWKDRDNVKAARKVLEPWAEFAKYGRWPR